MHKNATRNGSHNDKPMSAHHRANDRPPAETVMVTLRAPERSTWMKGQVGPVRFQSGADTEADRMDGRTPIRRTGSFRCRHDSAPVTAIKRGCQHRTSDLPFPGFHTFFNPMTTPVRFCVCASCVSVGCECCLPCSAQICVTTCAPFPRVMMTVVGTANYQRNQRAGENGLEASRRRHLHSACRQSPPL